MSIKIRKFKVLPGANLAFSMDFTGQILDFIRDLPELGQVLLKQPKFDANGLSASGTVSFDYKHTKEIINITTGYCIYIDMLCGGPQPCEFEDKDGKRSPVIYATRQEAEDDIAEGMITRLDQYLNRERYFDDAVTCEEFAVSVDVQPDGSIVDEAGNCFSSENESV